MKLVTTTTALVAALSMFGCATDNDGEGGGHLAGLRPAKPSIDDPKSVGPTPSPAIEKILNGDMGFDVRGGDFLADPEISAETIKSPFPIKGICETCDLVVLKDRRVPGELNVLDQYGRFFCTLWVGDDGHVNSTNCRE